jgi:hypothetical protein
MAQWGNTDDAANSVLWATSQVNLPANTDNQTALFGNTTADAFVTGTTIGQYGVDINEVTAARAEGSGDRAAHAGWVLRTVGSGGRLGRTQTEVLVAMSSITTGSDAEDTVYEDAFITITTQPSNATANTTDSEEATFTVAASAQPTTAVLTYAWSYANGDSIQAGANVGNTTQATLTVNSAVETANVSYKVTVASTGADSKVSSNATLTITT